MVYLGRSKFNPKTGVYVPLVVAQNMDLKDGDLLEFHMENDTLYLRRGSITESPKISRKQVSDR